MLGKKKSLATLLQNGNFFHKIKSKLKIILNWIWGNCALLMYAYNMFNSFEA